MNVNFISKKILNKNPCRDTDKIIIKIYYLSKLESKKNVANTTSCICDKIKKWLAIYMIEQ